jgi:hypothetical protein
MGRHPTIGFKILISLLMMRQHFRLCRAFRGFHETELEAVIEFSAEVLQSREIMSN